MHSRREAAPWTRESVLCEPGGAKVGEVRKEGRVLTLSLVVVWQRPTRYCRAIIPQLKMRFHKIKSFGLKKPQRTVLEENSRHCFLTTPFLVPSGGDHNFFSLSQITAANSEQPVCLGGAPELMGSWGGDTGKRSLISRSLQ